MIKIACWDKHGDEFKRLKRHLDLIDDVTVIRYQSQEPPDSNLADIFFVHEGSWLQSIPAHIRHRCVLAPCIKLDGYVNYFKSLGFVYAVCKTNHQLDLWNNENAVIVPSICEPLEPIQLDKQNDIISLIHLWKNRDQDSFYLAKQIPNLKMYGEGEGQLGYVQDIEALKTAKFLVHIKNIGYVCNAVIKSISMGVPVLTTTSTIPYGYEDLLIHNVNAIVCSDISCLINATTMSDDFYMSLRNNCLSMRPKLTQPDPEAVNLLKELVLKIYHRHCNT